MKPKVVIVGGGPAGLFTALFLDTKLFDVTIIEKEKTIARKFLVAGNGGFNLSNHLPTNELIKQYSPPLFLKPAITYFNNSNLQDFFDTIGIKTFVGSSGKIFPTPPTKPIEVIQAITKKTKTKRRFYHYPTKTN